VERLTRHPELNLAEHPSLFAEQLRRGFPGLKFVPPLEQEFRDFYVAQNLQRTKFAGLIALVVVLAVASIDLTLGNERDIDLVRLAVLAPLLAVLTLAVSLPVLRPWYTAIMAVGIGFIGLVVTYIAHSAALGGASYVLVDLVVVILYGCLFVGLLFNVAVYLAALMTVAHVVAGLSFGLPLQELLHTSAVLAGAALIGGMSTYNLEHSLRTTFLETGLLNELAEQDGLTGLYNRRIFDYHVDRLWRHARRDGASLAVVLVDIDHFKVFNDLYGHQAGDDCLRKVAQCVARGAKRPLDLAARYGGEEFVLAFLGPPDDYVRNVAEQIRRDVAALAIPHAGSVAAKCVTVSVGLAVAMPATERSVAGIIQLADEALYKAKREGRNTVAASDDETGVETGKFRVVIGDQR
jgi:diguanylate cyclase (GGDEF)-like protein